MKVHGFCGAFWPGRAVHAEYADVSHRVFVTPRRVHFVESEYAVPRESMAGVLAELRRAVPRLADPVVFPVRPLYPRFDDFRRVRAEVDPEARFGNSYLTRVLGPVR